MKNIKLLSILALIAAGFAACNLDNVNPQQPPPTTTTPGKPVDTSKTVITNTSVVGNWNLVSDTLSYAGTYAMYRGVPNDHYIFTKYGNLYINVALNKYVDTAVYSISTTNKLQWVNTYTSANGVATTTQSSSAPFDITSVDAHNLVLTCNQSTVNGTRYEVIILNK
jgi:hypothetical protein